MTRGDLTSDFAFLAASSSGSSARGRFPGETSALYLIWAVLELASHGWRGVVMSPRAVAEIERLRRGVSGGTDSSTEEVIAA